MILDVASPRPWVPYGFGGQPRPGPYIVGMFIDGPGPQRGYTVTWGKYNPNGGTYWPGHLRSSDRERARANMLLTCHAVNHHEDLVKCLQAHEDRRQLLAEVEASRRLPNPADPRYTPMIGLWNGTDAPEVRFERFRASVKAFRRATLARVREDGGAPICPTCSLEQPEANAIANDTAPAETEGA